METNRCKVKMGVILCKHCDSVIDTLDTEKVTVYYLECSQANCTNYNSGRKQGGTSDDEQ